MPKFKEDTSIYINSNPSFETSYSINNQYNILKLKDLYEKEKYIDSNGLEILKIKDYQTLCSIIEAKIISDKKIKIAQNKDFKRFFSFSKRNKAYFIDTIYDIPLPKGFYNNPIDVFNEYFICNLIEDSPNKTLIRGINKLALQLGYVNEYFFDWWNHPNKLSFDLFSDSKQSQKKLFENLDIIQELYNYIPSKYTYRLNKALNSLKNKGIIVIETIYFGKKISFDVDTQLSIYNRIYDNDEFGDIKQEFIKIPIKSDLIDLSDDEVNQYSKIYKDTLSSFGFTTISDLFKMGYNKETNSFFVDDFYKKLSQTIEKEMGYSSVFEAYKFYFHKNYIKQEIPSLYSKLLATKIINQNFYEKLIQNKENELNRKLKQLEIDKEKLLIPDFVYQRQLKKEKDIFKKEKKVIDKLILNKT